MSSQCDMVSSELI